jgi:pimeloyl-ACP methyl ester carboxylesterase
MAFFDTFWHRTLRRPYRLAAQEQGTGPTPVVLLHGVGASGRAWAQLLKLLDPAKYRVIVPDLLGFGDSPKPQWSEYTAEDHAKNVLATLKKHGIRRPAIFIGHSMGCIVATHLATTQPALTQRLILYEPPLLGEIPDFPGHTRRSARYKAFFEYIASHPQLAHVEAHILWRVARKLWGMHLSEEEWLPFERSLRNTILRQQAYDALQNIAVRTDIVYGRLDLVVIRKGISRMFKRNKHIRLHVVTDFHGISARSARYLVGLL